MFVETKILAKIVNKMKIKKKLINSLVGVGRNFGLKMSFICRLGIIRNEKNVEINTSITKGKGQINSQNSSNF